MVKMMCSMGSNEVYEIGRSAPRYDGYDKVIGRERYAADYYPENFLWVGVKRSEYAHGRIQAIHSEAARLVPGVAAVLTHKEITGTNRLGVFEKDQPILADDTVRHYGDAVALVVAESQAALAAGLAAVVVHYEPLPAVFCSETAVAPGAPLLHPGRTGGNVLLRSALTTGQGSAALSKCAFTASVMIQLPWQDHAFLETQTGVAWQEEDGELTLVVSTQTPFRDRLELAEALGLTPTRMRIIAPYLGGGFGGKDGITVQGFLALAAMHVPGKAVKMHYSREESILAGTKRHPAKITCILGCDRNGHFQALECSMVLDTGPYAALGGEVFALAMEHAGGPYRIPNSSITGSVVYTNNPVSSAFRGFGVPQASAGIEQAIDELAQAAGMDPLQLRLRNVIRRSDVTPAGVVLTTALGLADCLEAVQTHPLWQSRREWAESAPPYMRRGTGIAACFHGQGFGPAIADYANAKAELTEKGRIRIYSGVADMGQGNASTCLQIASHILCQPYEDMELITPDTAKTLPSASSSASRTTFTYGNALKEALASLRNQIIARAALLFSFQLLQAVHGSDIILLPGRALHTPSGKELPLTVLAGMMASDERTATASYVCQVAGQTPTSGANLRHHGFPHRIFSAAAQLVRIEVDLLTGTLTVCDVLTCVEAGRILNPQLAEQQIQGAVAQGLGYALWEEFLVDDGRISTNNLATYIVPTALDMPSIETVFISLAEDEGPFGMKGIGEIGLDGVYPAVANAVAAVVGQRIGQGPLTAVRILTALGQEDRPWK